MFIQCTHLQETSPEDDKHLPVPQNWHLSSSHWYPMYWLGHRHSLVLFEVSKQVPPFWQKPSHLPEDTKGDIWEVQRTVSLFYTCHLLYVAHKGMLKIIYNWLFIYKLQVKTCKNNVATSESAATYCTGIDLLGTLTGSYRLAGFPCWLNSCHHSGSSPDKCGDCRWVLWSLWGICRLEHLQHR